VTIALAALLGVVTLGAGLALLVGRGTRSIAFASRRIVPPPIHLFAPGSSRVPGPPGRTFVGNGIAGFVFHPLAWMLFMVGILGLGLFALLYWSVWSRPRRSHRHERQQTPSWN
jgi:hypothetical protein